MTNPETDSGRLRAHAAATASECAAARALAHTIEVRRHGLATRLDPVRVRHTADVWSSGAASVSRAHLERVIGRDMWNATEHLRRTSLALDQRADELEAESRRAGRRADEIDAQVAALSPLGDSFS